MGRDTIQLENAVSTISQEYLLEFTSEYGIPEDLHPELPGPEDTIMDFPDGKVGVYTSDRRSQNMDLFNLISAPNPTKVKTGTRPHAAHEVPLLTVTANRMIDMEDPVATTTFSETPCVMEMSPLDFSSEDPPPMITNKGETEDQAPAVVSQEVPSAENIITTEVVPEVNLEKEIATMRPPINKKRHKRDRSAVEANEPPKPQPIPDQDIAQSSKGTTTEIPTEGVATTEACQDMIDHTVPPGYFSELRHLPNTEFLAQYNVNLAWQVALGSQMRLRFEQEVRLLKKARAQVARRSERIQVREEEIKRLGEEVESLKVVEAKVHGLRNQTKNLETLLEAEVDMKKATEAKNAELAKELESLRAKFSDLQLNNNQLSQQVSTLQVQVTSEERIKTAFEEFKKCEDNKVEQRCAEMDARLDKPSVDIDEELYPHMLTMIAGRHWVIGHGLRLAIMKCIRYIEIRQAFANVVSAGLAKGMSEGLKYDIEHGKAGRDLADVEAYDLEANNKLVKALKDLKDLKYPMSDTREDAPQWIRDLRSSSSQLKIPIYPEVRAPEDPWAVKEEVPLEDTIAANISRAEKKKKCRVVCRTHGIGSAHHARSDGIPVSVPTVVPQGLAILLADAGTQTQRSEDEASPRLLRSKSLPPMYNLDWP
ncbi:hypothetical protein Tco_0400673 [Tanacetum coccineum]